MPSSIISLNKGSEATTVSKLDKPSLSEPTVKADLISIEEPCLTLSKLQSFAPKVLVTDLDSTLWNSNGLCPELNKNVSRQLKEKGIPQIICTGRSLEGAERGLNVFNVPSLSLFPGIYNDGAIVYGDSINEELSCSPLSLEDLKEITALALQMDPACRFTYVLKHCHMTDDRSFLDAFNVWNDTILEKAGFPDTDCLSLCIFSKDHNRLYENFCHQRPDHVYLPYDAFQLLLVRPRGINKLTGIQTLIKHYGWIDSEVVVIGDGLNDVEMLEGMQLSIVMKDGHHKALAVGKCETELPSFEGGWGNAIQKVFSLE